MHQPSAAGGVRRLFSLNDFLFTVFCHGVKIAGGVGEETIAGGIPRR
jgi:hypothetical protein